MSSSSAERTLPWLDRPMRELTRLAWPIAVSTLSYSVMTLVDTLYVSRLGASALAGVGLGGIAAFTLLCFSLGLLRGVKIVVSQAVGAGQSGEIEAYVRAGLTVACGLGLLTVLVGLICAPLVGSLASTPAAGHAASTYLRVRILGAPLLLVYVSLREARYGQGDARSPMIATVAANVVNVGLDYLLISVLGMGVAGAAWASVTAHAVEAAILVGVQRQFGLPRLGGWGGAHMVALFRVGLPTGIQFLLEIGSFSVLTVMLSAMSDVQLASHQIVLQVIHLSFLPAHAVAEAGSVLVGQVVGARRDDLVGGIATRSMAIAAGYTGLCTVVFGLGARFIVGLFAPGPEVFETAVRLMYVAVVFLVADGANVVARGILRGTGDVRYAAVVGIVTAWLCTPPITWFLGVHLGMGALGGWIALSVEIFAGATVFWLRLRRGGWRGAAARSRADQDAVVFPDAVAVSM